MATRRKKKLESTIPEVNLVPMMDVLMTVLTFFIIISMSLSSQSILTVEAPKVEESSDTDTQIDSIEPFVVGLNVDGEILLSDEPVDRSTLGEEMRLYYADNPEGYIRLKADRALDYRAVTTLLITLRDLGGGRVALVYE